MAFKNFVLPFCHLMLQDHIYSTEVTGLPVVPVSEITDFRE